MVNQQAYRLAHSLSHRASHFRAQCHGSTSPNSSQRRYTKVLPDSGATRSVDFNERASDGGLLQITRSRLPFRTNLSQDWRGRGVLAKDRLHEIWAGDERSDLSFPIVRIPVRHPNEAGRPLLAERS